jgi:cystathionine beta-synthase
LLAIQQSSSKGFGAAKGTFQTRRCCRSLFSRFRKWYVGKMFNDDWMSERAFLYEKVKTAEDIINDNLDRPLILVRTKELVSRAIERMRKHKISQIPVIDVNGFVGSVDELDLFESYVHGPIQPKNSFAKLWENLIQL